MRKRAERRCTVVLVPHGAGSSRAVEVSHTMAGGLLAIGGVGVLTIIVLAVVAVARGVEITRNRALERENRELIDQVQWVRAEILSLRDSLLTIGQRDQALRLVAGLSVLDPAVQEAGIGGPRGSWPERDTLEALGRDGEQALAARMDLDGVGRRASILLRSLDQAYDSLSSHDARFAATPSIMPAHGYISSPFAAARMDPILHIVRPHEGMDVAAPMGTAIEAPAAGIVTEVASEDGYGNYVTIDHGYGVVTRYAHCSKILVVRGQRVTRGQTIALVGSTGESTGPHVHYEVRVNGKAVDPKTFVLPDDVITD